MINIFIKLIFLQVNFRPYLFELFLKHKIEPEKSSVSVRDGKVTCILSKSIIEKWDLLEEEPKSREEAQSLRVKALEEYETLQIEKNKEKKGWRMRNYFYFFIFIFNAFNVVINEH